MNNSTNIHEREFPEIAIRRQTMNGKPVHEIDVKTIINFQSKFGEKYLCDGLTFSLGSACAYNCAFCYVLGIVRRHPQIVKLLKEIAPLSLTFDDIVIRRMDALDVIREQLTNKKPRRVDLSKPAVIFTSPLVDPAANPTLARETLGACLEIFERTAWTVRILSKSNLLPIIAQGLPEKYRNRVIFGVSTGTLDDNLARSFEERTPLVSKRLESLRWLQGNGFRTFGMICPSLPQENYDKFAADMAAAIRADLCEHVWAEAINVRGNSLTATCAALENGGFNLESERLKAVSGPGNGAAWEEYARATFTAHTRCIPPEKLRFLQYVSAKTRPWWQARRNDGAVLLGKAAHEA
jgi:DNA repair photolyase